MNVPSAVLRVPTSCSLLIDELEAFFTSPRIHAWLPSNEHVHERIIRSLPLLFAGEASLPGPPSLDAGLAASGVDGLVAGDCSVAGRGASSSSTTNRTAEIDPI